MDFGNSPSDNVVDNIGGEYRNISAEIPMLPHLVNWDCESPVTREDYAMISSVTGSLAEDMMP